MKTFNLILLVILSYTNFPFSFSSRLTAITCHTTVSIIVNSVAGGIFMASKTKKKLPAELLYPTVEYILSQQILPPPVFMLVVDSCLVEEELETLKDSLQQVSPCLPACVLSGCM